jgi:tetratricopeptide (TPR) repeat protein
MRGLPSPEWDVKGWKLWEQLASHCWTLLDRLRNHALEPKATRMMNELARWFKNRAEHGEAEPLMRRALAIDENNFGSEHPDVARDLNNLALLLRETNRFTEAESLMRRALAIAQKNFVPDHPNVAICFNNLAELFHETNQLAKAEPLHRRALAIDEKSFGPDHPDVAIDLNNLARLLSHMNRLAEAETLSRRHLRIFAEFGRRTRDEHPHFRTAINNYAGLLAAMGFSESEILSRLRSAIECEPDESA